jgi:uncharacterized YccA/Bax inhibitor family protein
VRSSNPVLTRLTPETYSGQTSGYGSPYQPAPPPVSVVAEADRMTIDDVVVKTVALLSLTALSGLATALLPLSAGALWGAVAIGGIVGLVLGLIVSFKRVISPPLIVAYAIAEGVFVGGISKIYNAIWDGIVVQAALATFGIFFLMAALYKTRIIRNSPRFTRIVMGGLLGVLGLIVANLIFGLFGVNLHLRDGSPLAIVFSLVVIGVAALTFVLDFDMIEQAAAQGAPKQTAWLCAFGLLVGLIWVYLEVLRLLSYLRGRN